MNNEKFVEAIERLQYIKQHSKDYIVPSDAIKVYWNANTNQYILESDTPDGHKEFFPSKIAFDQICEKLNIPRTYVKYCESEKSQQLIIENINYWLAIKPTNFLLRTLDTTLRAFLSDRFRLIDNYDVAMLFLDTRKEIMENTGIDIQISDITLSETNMYIKATSPQLTGTIIPDIEDRKRDDIINGGIIINNSDIGKGRFSINSYVEILRCSNGLIGEVSVDRVHIGKKLETGEIKWSERSQQLVSEAFWSQAKDMITSAFTQEVFEKWLSNINKQAKETITKPTIAIDNIIKTYNINEEHRDELLMEFAKLGHTKWSLAQAVTQVAQKKQNYDDRISMETAGANILVQTINSLEKE